MDDIKNTTEEDLNVGNKKTSSNFLRMTKWVIIFAAVLAVAIFFASTVGVNKLRSARAGAQVTDFIGALYPSSTIVGKVCQGEDTDNDGYVSCAVTITSRENPLSVQCPTIMASFLGTTCRLTPGVSPVNM
jgi:ABC-type phosphate/phosphonate transport system permease subunit